MVRRNLKIRGNMTPEPGWEHVGSYAGAPVYREKLPNMILQEQTDRMGKTIYVKDPRTGAEMRPRYSRIQNPDPDKKWTYRDFVLVDLGNGMVKKNYRFTGPTPGEIEPTREEAMETEIAELKAMVMAMLPDEGQDTQTEGDDASKRKPGRPRKQPVEAEAAEVTS